MTGFQFGANIRFWTKISKRQMIGKDEDVFMELVANNSQEVGGGDVVDPMVKSISDRAGYTAVGHVKGKRSGKRGPVGATARGRLYWARLRRAALASRAQNHLMCLTVVSDQGLVVLRTALGKYFEGFG